MRLCANYAEGNTRFYVASMRELYPHLKRWAKKEDTESEYYRSLNRVIGYVKEHLHENTDLKTLAGIARISPYHFHRIFKSFIGESLGDYVNRLRMEYVAGQLKTSGLSLAELAERTGYSSEQALSRAFKKYFDIPPKTFKTMFFRELFKGEITPRICRVAAKNVVMLREMIPGGRGWQKLYMYAVVNSLMNETTESLEVISEGVYRPALTAREAPAQDRHAESATLPEGIYAIFTHRGEPAAIEGLYAAVRNLLAAEQQIPSGSGLCLCGVPEQSGDGGSGRPADRNLCSPVGKITALPGAVTPANGRLETKRPKS